MTYKEMLSLQEQVFDRVRKLRETKGKEYAGEEDTLADFKEIGRALGIDAMRVWAVYTQKHQRAIETYIREGHVKSEAIEDRIVDVICYHILLLGLIADTDGDQQRDVFVGLQLQQKG